jgi:hypothetical protein
MTCRASPISVAREAGHAAGRLAALSVTASIRCAVALIDLHVESGLKQRLREAQAA